MMTAPHYCPPLGAPLSPPPSADVVKLERQMVVAEAHTWIGTPFHHRQRVKGAGVDCAQLLAAVYENARVASIGELPHYSADWYLHRSDDLLETVLERYAAKLPPAAQVLPGDIVTFTFGRQVSHAGVAVDPGYMVHALSGRTVTVEAFGPNTPYESRYAGAWRPRRWGR
jgi:NlpC/P60 family putative phage cell wall peptidase